MLGGEGSKGSPFREVVCCLMSRAMPTSLSDPRNVSLLLLTVPAAEVQRSLALDPELAPAKGS